MNGVTFGGPAFAVAVERCGVAAAFSASRRAFYGAIKEVELPAGEVSFANGRTTVSNGGGRLCEITGEYVDDLSAFLLHIATTRPLKYEIVPSPGTGLSAPVPDSTRGIDHLSVWLTRESGALCAALCGAAVCRDRVIEFTGGSGYIVLCEGGDMEEVACRVSHVVGLYEQGYFARRAAFSRPERGDEDRNADLLSCFRAGNGLILRGTDDLRADAFTQYLAIRAYAAQERYGEAAELLSSCLAHTDGSGGLDLCIDGAGGRSQYPRSLSPSLITLAALTIPAKRFPRELYSALAASAEASASEIRRGMMPFCGCEDSRAARLFPEYGSAVATSAFIAAARGLEKRSAQAGFSLSDRLIKSVESAEKSFAENFIPGGKPVEYCADRASGVRRKKYRTGYCSACGDGVQKRTVRTQGGGYLCLDCYTAGAVPAVIPAKRKKSLSSVLYAVFLGAEVYPPAVVNEMMTAMLKGEVKPDDPLEYYMLLDAVSHSPYYRRYREIASRLADENTDCLTSAACRAAKTVCDAKQRKRG